MGSGHVHPTAQPIHGCFAKGKAIFCHLELFPWPTGKQTDWHAFIAHPIGESEWKFAGNQIFGTLSNLEIYVILE